MYKVRRVITSRCGGVSRPPYDELNLADHAGDDPAAVAANRARLVRELGVPADQLVWMSQAHGAKVHTVAVPPPGPVAATDALVTGMPGVVLCVLVADCVPVLLADRRAGVVAAAHAGRAGAAAGIIPRTLAVMRLLGADPTRTEALLGPAVCGRCYEVPASLQAEVERALPGSAIPTRWGSPGLDLRGGIARQLAAAGLGHIAYDPRCTVEDPDLYSFRRDGTTGRQAGITWLAP
ncbi:MAG TPA: peptidoglycan editing factor PgeF [Mycobacteriales bacterium]|nr:peptidoglycan editing factor PgeF [Mycobacteriales bacterium]